MKTKAIICIFMLLHLLSYAQNKTYYISSNGSDINNGLSSTTAWQTLSKINNLDLEPGDKILLEGGSTFTGAIQLDQYDSGTPSNPIFISSYGAGRATIHSLNETALYALNAEAVHISNLAFEGNNSSSDGIYFAINQTSRDLDFIYIDSIEVSGFNGIGLAFGALSTDKGFNNVTVLNSSFHNNGHAGLETFGNFPIISHTAFKIAFCKFYENYGTTNTTVATGSGLTISGVDGGLVEYCEAYNNGTNNKHVKGGPVGIWVYDTKNVTIQYCESHHNKAGLEKDGGGFDIYGGSQNCVIQYCYSHDNEGAGFLMAEYGSPNEYSDNTIRYNISQNDGRKNDYGGITIYAKNEMHQVKNCKVYNNTIYVNGVNIIKGTPSAFNIASQNFKNVQISNNIFYVTQGIDLINSLTTQDVDGVRFLNNNYYATGDYHFRWNEKDYTSLNDWKSEAIGQEIDAGIPKGIMDNPLLIEPGSGGIVHPSDGGSFRSLFGYTLHGSSPLINNGINLANTGGNDFFGNSIPQSLKYDIGAFEFTASNVLPLSITNFGALIQSNQTLLWWKAYNEDNVQKYEVLKSNNGIQFSSIGTIHRGNANNYMFTDNEKPGNSFYRIKYVYADGRSGMSSTLKVSAASRKDMVSIYNEGQGLQLQIWSDQNAIAYVHIYNAGGALLASFGYQLEKGNNNIMVSEAAQLRPGIYFVSVTLSGKTTNGLKFVKAF